MLYYSQAIQKEQTLQIIRYMESNNGKDTHHASSAYGSYGIKPTTALELGYKITKKNEHEVASKLYDKLSTIAKGNTRDIVYGWLKGSNGLRRQYNKPLYYRNIENHWHVLKYRKYIPLYMGMYSNLFNWSFYETNSYRGY